MEHINNNFSLATQKQLCELLQTSKVELLKWRRHGLKVYSAPHSSRIYYDLNEVKDFIKRCNNENS